LKIFARKQFCCLKDADGTNCKLDCGLNVDEKDDDKELEMTGCGVYWCDLWSETKVDRVDELWDMMNVKNAECMQA